MGLIGGSTSSNPDNSTIYNNASNELAVKPSNIIESGSSSDITYSSNTTLTSNAVGGNITINTGVTLTTNGHNIYASGTFTNNGTINTGTASNGGAGGAAGIAAGGNGGGGANGIIIQAYQVAAAGVINANGGAGQSITGGTGGAAGSGGGGGGGVIIIAYGPGGYTAGTYNYNGGAAGTTTGTGTTGDGNAGGNGGATTASGGTGATTTGTAATAGTTGTSLTLTYSLMQTIAAAPSTYLVGNGGGGGGAVNSASAVGSTPSGLSSSYGGSGGGGGASTSGSAAVAAAAGGNGQVATFNYDIPPVTIPQYYAAGSNGINANTTWLQDTVAQTTTSTSYVTLETSSITPSNSGLVEIDAVVSVSNNTLGSSCTAAIFNGTNNLNNQTYTQEGLAGNPQTIHLTYMMKLKLGTAQTFTVQAQVSGNTGTFIIQKFVVREVY